MKVAFWIWALALAFALTTFGFIARSLFIRAEATLHQVNRLLKNAEPLLKALDAQGEYTKPGDNLLDDPEQLLAKRAQMMHDKAKKREGRQRRLIKSLKNFNPDESRFH